MWSIVINHIPAARLETWAWWLGVFAITLPIFGGVCGWLSFEMNDTVTHRKEIETQQQIAEAKAAALPKPLTVRLTAFLNALDSRILPALVSQDVKWSGQLRADQSAELEGLFHESGTEKYISRQKLEVNAMEMLSDGSMTHGVTFVIHQKLLEDTKTP